MAIFLALCNFSSKFCRAANRYLSSQEFVAESNGVSYFSDHWGGGFKNKVEVIFYPGIHIIFKFILYYFA
jgi:hypothetical protein